MSINGIEPRVTLPFIQPTQARTAEERATALREDAGARQSLAAQPALAEAAATLDASLSAEAPEGTDPALWSVLTSEERVYFARVQSLGPLTYGRGERAPALPRGGRIDVQV